jgi:hypothetical protein
MVPEATWQYVQTFDPVPNTTYKFNRVSAPAMDPYKPHPNSYFISKQIWDRVGGYDERFAGYYGTDGDFRDRLNQHSAVDQMKPHLIRVPREYIHDASTTRYARKTPADAAIRDIKGERAAYLVGGHLRSAFPMTASIPKSQSLI